MPGPVIPIPPPSPAPGVQDATNTINGIAGLFGTMDADYRAAWQACWCNPAGYTPQQYFTACGSQGAMVYGLAQQFYTILSQFDPSLSSIPPCPAGWKITPNQDGTATATQGPAASFQCWTLPLGSQVANGVAQSIGAKAYDAASFLSLNYNGTVNVTSGDTAANLPGPVAFVAGQATFNVTFGTSGPQTLTITDTVNAALTQTLSVEVN